MHRTCGGRSTGPTRSRVEAAPATNVGSILVLLESSNSKAVFKMSCAVTGSSTTVVDVVSRMMVNGI